MEKIGQQNNLADRLQKKLEAERQQVEEITAKELQTLAANLHKTSEDALNSIRNDINEQMNGLMPSLKTALKPIIWTLAVCALVVIASLILLVVIGGMKKTELNYLIEKTDRLTETAEKLKAITGRVDILTIKGEQYIAFPEGIKTDDWHTCRINDTSVYCLKILPEKRD